jgi:trans-aconitate methyltransferase
MDLKESALLGDAAAEHWYYRSKALAIRAYLGDRRIRRILDIGAGSGFFTRYLLEHSSAASGMCVDTGYEADRDEQWSGKAVSFRRSCDVDDADLVLFMDVLEHVDDDSGLLASYAAKVPPGATFLVTVPAFQWLWSSHDVFLEHRRRYHVAQLEATVARAGLQVVRCSYYFGFVLPIAAALRLAERLAGGNKTPRSQLALHSRPVDQMLRLLCRAEIRLLNRNRLGGLSVFCLAVKPA